MKPSTLHCPYCHTKLEFGAQHCINCSARLEYGAPDRVYAGVALVSSTIGVIFTNLSPPSLDWLGAPATLVSGAVMAILVHHIYRNYVEFHPSDIQS